jgi:large subunit ribosomal protein L35
MPKMKSRSSASKRFRVTGSGKIRHDRANASHKFLHKSRKRKRRLRRGGIVNGSDVRRLRKQLAMG